MITLHRNRWRTVFLYLSEPLFSIVIYRLVRSETQWQVSGGRAVTHGAQTSSRDVECHLFGMEVTGASGEVEQYQQELGSSICIALGPEPNFLENGWTLSISGVH